MQKLSQPLLMTLEENRAALKASESRTYQPNGTREQQRRRRQREKRETKSAHAKAEPQP